ncbi:hypothetical protein A3752_20165 [Oleiphilus sp. HI0081]|uniref:hypothetical protein n=1 Tax=unclassified Oleiphilus TaxID=2631174 RepID=UPI0007C3DFED|nr:MULTISPECIES: hypothetical protein [unclassified Oleiphilus]KZY89013.1 hypothetical protein A3743_09550 [Oleiphilus sp. HI0072]KZZ18341.1 hypothetical protein A3749_04010 [Oleiphilus sp. HI0078]KZZ28956.1 hypothetical protein A3752_20165 [Oleiphilus sp. HI0081]KZY38073.1 hypothetical protein A3729_16140 [Oleiphilus sp. HI0043]KZZ62563.1 hypothetical protein A3763_07855 [Oleiphilus sp. HI0128]
MYTSSRKRTVSKNIGKKRKVMAGKVGYDLSLDRRVGSRRDSLMPSLESLGPFDRRHTDDRRMDKRPLSDFPYLPEVII